MFAAAILVGCLASNVNVATPRDSSSPASSASSLPADQTADIARDAYIYAYPLILMEFTRRVGTNVADTKNFGKAPMDVFANAPAFPDANFTDVVRPNADTLYSTLWFDVSNEPLIVRVPDSGGRYYLLPMLDMWSDIFASTGARTTGTGPQLLAITGPNWRGTLPEGVIAVRSPTAFGWILGRTQTNGKADYAAVRQFQAALAPTPLSRWGKPLTATSAPIETAWDSTTPPVDQVENLSPAAFFTLFHELVQANPPHANDYPILHRMQRIGIDPAKPFAFDKLSPDVQRALTTAKPEALGKIKTYFTTLGAPSGGWRTNQRGLGTYGTDYLTRATVAFAGLGANVVEDAIYPTAITDADGKPFSSDNRYVLHFDKGNIPPARAFWSLTMYDERQLFTANPIDRFAIGDRDKLKANADGSIDIYIQRDSPGKDKESNWLPAPTKGAFTMNLRLYWPKTSALDGSWLPPGVRRVN